MTDVNEGTAAGSPEEKEQTPEEETTTVRVCLFYDGTLNNRSNVQARTKKRRSSQEIRAFDKHSNGESSYDNDESNISKLEPNVEKDGEHDFVFSIYTEGPGTTDLDSDSSIGYALGEGGTGVPAKVKEGIRRVERRFQSEKQLSKKKKITKLTIDAFGFSRGAAGARYFIYKALSTRRMGRTPPRHLAKRLRNLGYNIEDNAVTVNFVGLFDTVASYGIKHSNDTGELKLDSISTYKAKNVLHLVAADEHRSNFSLTNIKSVSGNGKTVYLPGVHSDIGGGYTAGKEELHLRTSYSLAELKKDKAKLINDGWFTEKQIWIDEYKMPPPRINYGGFGAAGSMPPMPQPHNMHSLRKRVGNQYDRIPLHIMVDFTRTAGLSISSKAERNNNYKSDPLLSPIGDYLKSYSHGSSQLSDWSNPKKYSWLPTLRNKYLHFSAHLKPSLVVLTPHKPNLENGQRIRVVHYG